MSQWKPFVFDGETETISRFSYLASSVAAEDSENLLHISFKHVYSIKNYLWSKDIFLPANKWSLRKGLIEVMETHFLFLTTEIKIFTVGVNSLLKIHYLLHMYRSTISTIILIEKGCVLTFNGHINRLCTRPPNFLLFNGNIWAGHRD